MARTSYHYAAGTPKRSSAFRQSTTTDDTLLWKCILLIGLTYLVWSEKISIVFDLGSTNQSEQRIPANGHNVKAGLLSMAEERPSVAPHHAEKKRSTHFVHLPANAKGHAVFAIDPDFPDRNQIPAETVNEAALKCRDYIERFAPVAVAEMRKFGIPASIILAQGLLESNAGDSKLAQTTNNHFGIKCFSNRCKKGHCANFSDDSHKDFFVRYANVWSSFRAHSLFLKNSRRYATLFQLDSRDYRGWAKGLEQTGYATDRNYAEKLIALIQNLELQVYDLQ